MQMVLSCSGFVEACEYWRQHSSPDNMLTTVYDGNIWRSFFEYNNRPFLAERYTYGLILNIDWFQPYKHLAYSVGVVYLSVLNLPSHLRYIEANTLLVGILSGPHKPKLAVNTLLEPLVNDLMEFWSGISLDVQTVGKKRYAVHYNLSLVTPLLDASSVASSVTVHDLAVQSLRKLLLVDLGKVIILDLTGRAGFTVTMKHITQMH